MRLRDQARDLREAPVRLAPRAQPGWVVVAQPVWTMEAWRVLAAPEQPGALPRPGGELVWAKRAGGNAEDFALSVSVVLDGSSLVAGYFRDTATFGPGEPMETALISTGEFGLFVARYKADGSLAWAKRAGVEEYDSGLSISALGDGSALIAGSFLGTATFGPGESGQTVLSAAGQRDVFVARYNAGGSLAWAKRAGGTGHDYGKSVSALVDGSLVVTGYFDDTATFGDGEPGETVLSVAPLGSQPTPYPRYDLFVARYHADGSLAWAKRAGGTGYDYGKSVSALADGSALITGYFDGTATFGDGEPGETVLSAAGQLKRNDVFVARYNEDGSLAWAKRAGGKWYDYGHCVAALADGSALVTGSFDGTVTFGLGEPHETVLTSVGEFDLFVARYNANGSLAWVKRVGGTGQDSSVSALADGSAVVTGYFTATATFGSGESRQTVLTAAGLRDVFVARYNADGSLAWARRAGGAGYDSGSSVSLLASGSAVVTGSFDGTPTLGDGTATFGPGEPGETVLTSAGSLDMFIARFAP